MRGLDELDHSSDRTVMDAIEMAWMNEWMEHSRAIHPTTPSHNLETYISYAISHVF